MYKRILHATDLSEHHFYMCEQSARLAKQLNATLFLLHVIEPPPSLQLAQGLGFAEFDSPPLTDAKAVMAVLGEALQIPVEHQWVEIGSIKTHCLEKIKDFSCDLIIVGKHTPSKLPSFLESSAHLILNHVSCDVLVLAIPE